MKKALVLMCLVTMMAASISLKAQDVTITLNPGWTWISYLGLEAQDFATALSSFTPAVGDIIKSQTGHATYQANGMWRGKISRFTPGYGYHYKSNRTEPVTLTLYSGHGYVDLGLPTASNGNSLFLPAAGYRSNSELYQAGSSGEYWLGSLSTDKPNFAFFFHFGSNYCFGNITRARNYGNPVRPVRSADQN